MTTKQIIGWLIIALFLFGLMWVCAEAEDWKTITTVWSIAIGLSAILVFAAWLITGGTP